MLEKINEHRFRGGGDVHLCWNKDVRQKRMNTNVGTKEI